MPGNVPIQNLVLTARDLKVLHPHTSIPGLHTSALVFKQRLQALDTIHTVTVDRAVVNADIKAFAWTVTFTHQVHEIPAGADNIGLMMVTDTTRLRPATTAEVFVTENIAGTSPMTFDISDLDPGTEYFVRVAAYNSRGFGVSSTVASGIPRGASPPPKTVSVSAASGTSLQVVWASASENNGNDVDGYDVQW